MNKWNKMMSFSTYFYVLCKTCPRRKEVKHVLTLSLKTCHLWSAYKRKSNDSQWKKLVEEKGQKRHCCGLCISPILTHSKIRDTVLIIKFQYAQHEMFCIKMDYKTLQNQIHFHKQPLLYLGEYKMQFKLDLLIIILFLYIIPLSFKGLWL